jgi:ABC-type lipoprotein release transport system permease subunit
MKELLLARSFIASPRGRGLHGSFVVSTVAVVIGASFLVLTMGVYDSYVEKLETITWSVYPHILVFEGKQNGGAPGAAGAAEAATEDEICLRICRGETLLGDRSASAERGAHLPSTARMADLRAVLAPARAGNGAAAAGHAAPLILDEADFPCRFQRGASFISEVRHLRVLGLEAASERVVPEVDRFVSPELMARLGAGGGPAVILSEELARSFFGDAEAAGQSLEILRPDAPPIRLEVLGTFSLGFHSISRNMLITPLATAQSLLGKEGKASYFGVALDDAYASRKVLERIRPGLRGVGLTATDWTAIAGGDFSNIRLFRWILLLVLGMSFVITALGIRNTLTILTVERRKQIGILRALGLRDASIRVTFLFIALAIGLVGSLFGLALGSSLSLYFGHWLDQRLIDLLPVHGVEMSLQPGAMLEVLALVMMSCAVTAFVSVSRALELDPVACLTAE